jgi:hypothetical protein
MDEMTKIKIEVILDELRQRRDEIVLLLRAMLGLGPLLVVVLSGAFVASLGTEVPPLISENRGLVLGFLNQLLFFLAVFTVLVLISMQIEARYVENREERLNALLGERVRGWESSGVLKRHSALPYLSAVLFLVVSAGFIALACLTFREVRSYWLLALNIAQLLIVWSAQIYDVIYSERKQRAWLSLYMSGKDAEQASRADGA